MRACLPAPAFVPGRSTVQPRPVLPRSTKPRTTAVQAVGFGTGTRLYEIRGTHGSISARTMDPRAGVERSSGARPLADEAEARVGRPSRVHGPVEPAILLFDQETTGT